LNDDYIVKQAYALELQQVFKTFVAALAVAQSPEAAEQAEARFKKGMELAREARDKALAMVRT
jgi:hypothetical protein